MSRLRLVSTCPAPAVGPLTIPTATPCAVSPEVQAQAENLRVRAIAALMPLLGKSSTDLTLARTKRDLYALATDLQRLARKLPS